MFAVSFSAPLFVPLASKRWRRHCFTVSVLIVLAVNAVDVGHLLPNLVQPLPAQKSWNGGWWLSRNADLDVYANLRTPKTVITSSDPTQLNWTELDNKSLVFCHSWSSEHAPNFTTDRKLATFLSSWVESSRTMWSRYNNADWRWNWWNCLFYRALKN